MKKLLIIGIIMLAIIAAIACWLLRAVPDSNLLTLYGNVDIRQISLAFEGSQRVAEMRVEEGDKVKAGQVLAVLDTRALNLQVQQAQAQLAVQEQVVLRLRNGARPQEIAQAKARLAAAQADATQASRDLQRLQTLDGNTQGRAVISRQHLDQASTQQRVAIAKAEDQRKTLQLVELGPRNEDIAQAQAQAEVMQSELALLQYYLQQAELKSPSDAVVRSRLLEPGDMASPQRPAYTLALTDPKWIRAYVTEPQLGLIQPGMYAQVTTDSHPYEPIVGQVGYISSVAEFTPKAVQTEDLRTSLVYEIRILVKDPEDRLRLGMPATVRMQPTTAQ